MMTKTKKDQTKPQKRTYPLYLLDVAKDMIKKELAWRQTSLTAELVNYLREAGLRITDKAREECWQAAKDALTEKGESL